MASEAPAEPLPPEMHSLLAGDAEEEGKRRGRQPSSPPRDGVQPNQHQGVTAGPHPPPRLRTPLQHVATNPGEHARAHPPRSG